MILHRLDRQLAVPQSLNGAVVQVDLAHLETRVRRERAANHLNLVILRRYVDTAARQVAHRMIRTVMSKREALRLGTRGARHDLMPEADAEQRSSRGDDLARQCNGPSESRRVPRARREHHADRTTL